MTAEDSNEGAKALARLMARRGLSAAEVSRRVEGDLGSSTVRAYTAGRSKPRPGKAIAIARIFDPEDGADLLRAWGYDDLAEGLLEENERLRRASAFARPLGKLDTPRQPPAIDPRSVSPNVGEQVRVEVIASAVLSRGGRILVGRSDSGDVYAMMPLHDAKGIAGL